MAYVKQCFNIKDLEKFSGIKAHTIRIWEKRYGILNPDRTKTNIRVYDVNALQKILNVSFLNGNGYKISRISKMTSEDIHKLVGSISTKKNTKTKAINALKLAMIKFDQDLFFETYNNLSKTHTFQEIFNFVFIPFLEKIGLWWQTDIIKPSQEHFISNLIRQKLYVNIEKLQRENKPESEKVFVLFLPEDEIHDIGLLYLNYELLLKKHNVIYLGPSLPFSDLRYLSEIYNNIYFLSYLTIQPNSIDTYIKEFEKEICADFPCHYWLLGRRVQHLKPGDLPENVKVFRSIDHLIAGL